MICNIEKKREVAALIPYKKNGNDIQFFLQKRDKDVLINPNNFGLFGGGIENGETSEAGMIREIKEELNFNTSGHEFFSRYEFAHHILDCFVLEVKNGFEDLVKVSEGEYGKFLSVSEVYSEPLMTYSTRTILKQFGDHLLGKDK